MKDKAFTLRIDTITMDILKKRSKEHHMTNSEYIRFLIRVSDIVNVPYKLLHFDKNEESEVTDIDEAE